MSQSGASRCVLDGRIGIEAPSVSWLGGSVRRGLPIPAPIRGIESADATVVRARQFPPYSRAAATVFHRLPVHGVSVIVNGARNLQNTQPHAPRELTCYFSLLTVSFLQIAFVFLVKSELQIRIRNYVDESQILNLKFEI